MRILLSTLHSRYSQTSLALRYIYANMPEKFSDRKISEFNINQDIESILDEILKENPDILCFSCYIWNIEKTVALCSVLKKMNNDIVIILGGPELSEGYDSLLLEKKADFIIRGEGDHAFSQLLDCIQNRKDPESVDNLVYVRNGIVIKNEVRPVSVLDELELPWKKELIDTSKNFIYYETSRGCPFSCKYCLSGISDKVRYYSLNIVRNILDNIIHSGFDTFRCIDRTFNLDEKRAVEIMSYILSVRKPGQVFQFEIKADLLGDVFFEFLEQIPEKVFQFEIGVQSMDKVVLRNSGRKENVDLLYENIRKIIKSGKIFEHIDLIIGLPGEKKENFRSAVKTMLEFFPYKLQINTLKLLKGSDFYRERHDNGLIFWDFPPYEVVCTNSMSREDIRFFDNISKLINIFYNSHYFDNTLRYFCEKSDIFSFFENLSYYFEENSIKLHSVSRANSFRIISDFIRLTYPDSVVYVSKILKYDFILSSIDFKNNDVTRFFRESSVTGDSFSKPDMKTNCIDFSSRSRFKPGKNLFSVNCEELPDHIVSYNGRIFYYFDSSLQQNIFISSIQVLELVFLLCEKNGLSISELEKSMSEEISHLLLEELIEKKIIAKI